MPITQEASTLKRGVQYYFELYMHFTGMILVAARLNEAYVLSLLKLIASTDGLGWLSLFFRILFQVGYSIFHLIKSIPGSSNPSAEFRIYTDLFDCGYPVEETGKMNTLECRLNKGQIYSIHQGIEGAMFIHMAIWVIFLILLTCYDFSQRNKNSCEESRTSNKNLPGV